MLEVTGVVGQGSGWIRGQAGSGVRLDQGSKLGQGSGVMEELNGKVEEERERNVNIKVQDEGVRHER